MSIDLHEKIYDAISTANPGEIKFKVKRNDGGSDTIFRRMPGKGLKPFEGTELSGEIAILSHDQKGHEHARLEISDEDKSVAAPRGVPVAQYQLHISERFVKLQTSRLAEAPPTAEAVCRTPAITRPPRLIILLFTHRVLSENPKSASDDTFNLDFLVT